MAVNKKGEIVRSRVRRSGASAQKTPRILPANTQSVWKQIFRIIFSSSARERINLNIIYWSGYWLSVVILTLVFNDGFNFDFSDKNFVSALVLALISSFIWPIVLIVFIIMWLSN